MTKFLKNSQPCIKLRFKLRFTSVNNLQSNQATERFHSSILEYIRLIQQNHKHTPITRLMLFTVWAYNNSVHSATNKKLIEIINGHIDKRNPYVLLLDK